MEKMKEIVLCIVVAFSLTTHTAMAAPPNNGYAFGGTTHLVGRDGLCLEISPFLEQDGSRLLLSPCEKTKHSQLWSILDDGTIRSLNNRYCLVPQSDTIVIVNPNVILRDCSKERSSVEKWIKKKDGTILHVESRLVLTGKPGKYVTLEINEDAPSQSWEATEVLYPVVVKFKWLDNLCLLSREGKDTYLFLKNCSSEDNQRWALYGDGTIRQNDHRYYCLTSSYRDAGSVVGVYKCEDKPQQRWYLTEDNTINHPNTNLVIDVHTKADSFPSIVFIDKRDGDPSQRWTIIY